MGTPSYLASCHIRNLSSLSMFTFPCVSILLHQNFVNLMVQHHQILRRSMWPTSQNLWGYRCANSIVCVCMEKKGTNRCKIGKIASLKTTYYLVRDKPDASGTHCVCFLCTCLRIHFSSLFQCLNIECRTVAVLGVDFLPHFFEMHSAFQRSGAWRVPVCSFICDAAIGRLK